MKANRVSRAADGQSAFRVGLMGTPADSGNRGVLALGASLVRLISEAEPLAEMALLIPSRTAGSVEMRGARGRKSINLVGYRLSPRAPIAQQLWCILFWAFLYRVLPIAGLRSWIKRRSSWVRFVAEADFVGDIRGGDSFSDIYGKANFIRGCLPVISVIWIRNGIHLLPQTYGPFESPIARAFARYILMRAESISCRDRVSLEEISRLTNGRRSGVLCPDVAFALEAVRPKSPSITPPLRRKDGETLIGINVNGLVYHGGYTRANMFGLALDYPAFLKGVVERLLATESNRILLIPHTFAAEGRVESDPAASRDLMRALPPELRDRVHLVDAEYDHYEIKGVIGMCDFFIGSRMHACIAALSQGIPVVGVAYSRKFAGVFGTVGVVDCVIDGKTKSTEEAIGRVVELFERRETDRAALRANIQGAQAELQRTFERLVSETGGRPERLRAVIQ